MRRKLRLRRPGHATVVAYLALFIALGGGTALAAFVVSSNSQIGPNTIYGHSAPTGANVNINLDSVTGADVKESTLARVPSAANGARKFVFDRAKKDDLSAFVNILTLNEMSLDALCYGTPSTYAIVALDVSSTVDAGVNYEYDILENANGFFPHHDPVAGGQTTTAQVVFFASGPGWTRADGQFVYNNAARAISATFTAIADNHTGRCQIRGSAIQAPN